MTFGKLSTETLAKLSPQVMTSREADKVYAGETSAD